MVTTETKSTTTSQSLQAKTEDTNAPFFDKDGGNSVLTNDSKESHFFDNNSSNSNQKTPFFSKPFVQTKLTIGQPGDKYEQEADAMADQVVQRLAENNDSKEQPVLKNSTGIQRKPIFESEAEPTIQAKPLQNNTLNTTIIQPKCSECEEEEKLQKMEDPGEEEQLQMKPIFESAAPPPDDNSIHGKCADCAHEEKTTQSKAITKEEPLQAKAEAPTFPTPSLESRLQSTKGSGSSLPKETRSQMEGAFGTDFSGVRVHTDSSAVQMNKDLGAQAFTHGSDVYFNAGKYSPGSREGQMLLSHELTHVVQQGGGTIQRKNIISGNSGSTHSIPAIQLSFDDGVLGRVGSFFNGVTRSVSNTVSNVANSVGETVSNVGSTLSGLGGQIFSSIRNLITSGLQSINSGWDSFQSIATNITNQLLNSETNVLDQLTAPFQAITNALQNFSAEGVSGGWNRLKTLANTLFNFVTNLMSFSLNSVTSAWQILGNIIDGIWNRVQSLKNRAIQILGNTITSGIETILAPLIGLISFVRRTKERIDQMVQQSIQYIREKVLNPLNQLINYLFDNFVIGFSKAVEYYRSIRQLVEEGEEVLRPIAFRIAQLVEPAPSKANETLRQKVQEEHGNDASYKQAETQIQLQTDTETSTRSMTSLSEFLMGMEAAILQVFGEANPLEIILEALVSLFHPWDYWSEDWGNFTNEWQEGLDRFYPPTGIHDFLTNLSHALNLLIIIARFLLAVLGRWSLIITLAMMLGLAILGGLVGGGVLGAGGTIVGTVLPGIGNAVGGAVGTGAGVLAGAGFGAGVGLSAGLAFGESLLIAYIATEVACVVHVIANLFLLLTHNQKLANLVRLVSCLFGVVVSFLLLALSFVGKAVAQKIAVAVGNIARRFLPEAFVKGFGHGMAQGSKGPISRWLERKVGQSRIKRIGEYPEGVGEVPIDNLHSIHDVPRAGTPEGHIGSIAERIRSTGYDVTQPVSATQLPDGTLLVTGGHHRIAAMRVLGEPTIPTRIYSHSSTTPYNLGRFVGIGRTTGKYTGDYIPNMPDEVRVQVNEYLRGWQANNPEQVQNLFQYTER